MHKCPNYLRQLPSTRVLVVFACFSFMSAHSIKKRYVNNVHSTVSAISQGYLCIASVRDTYVLDTSGKHVLALVRHILMLHLCVCISQDKSPYCIHVFALVRHILIYCIHMFALVRHILMLHSCVCIS